MTRKAREMNVFVKSFKYGSNGWAAMDSGWVHRDLGKSFRLKSTSHMTPMGVKNTLPGLYPLLRLHGCFIYSRCLPLSSSCVCPFAPHTCISWIKNKWIAPYCLREELRSLVPFLPSHFTSTGSGSGLLSGEHRQYALRDLAPALFPRLGSPHLRSSACSVIL